jgi:hypothetical protein
LGILARTLERGLLAMKPDPRSASVYYDAASLCMNLARVHHDASSQALMKNDITEARREASANDACLECAEVLIKMGEQLRENPEP